MSLNYKTAQFLYNSLLHINRWRCQLHLKSVSLAGVRSYYLEAEQQSPAWTKDTFVFIHGFADSMDSFGMVVYHLQRLGWKGRMILLDLPGFSISDKPDDFDYTFAGYANWLDQVMEQLNLQNVCLVGNSLGGGVALEHALRYPKSQRVRKLALLNSSNVVVTEVESFYSNYFSGKNLFNLKNYSDFIRFRDRLFLKPIHVPELISQLKYREYQENLTWNLNIIDQLFQGHSHVNAKNWREQAELHNQQLKQISLPVLSIWGEKDFLFPVQVAKIISTHIADTITHVYPAVGHCPQFEYPASVARDILHFIKILR
jgi:pimeloyl-ACP methyl ester carboxylesterase